MGSEGNIIFINYVNVYLTWIAEFAISDTDYIQSKYIVYSFPPQKKNKKSVGYVLEAYSFIISSFDCEKES